MSAPGSPTNPLRVAIVGAGPTGFYAAGHLFKQKELAVTVDMYERLPAPFGLVRYGVAPDHQKIKSVIKQYDRTARDERFRFFGNVEIGKDVSLADLRRHYHQIIYTFGAQSDRRLDVPGEDLSGSHPATEFVAWYNGHPDFRDHVFDLSQTAAAVIGVGNVAMDVCRILARTPEELYETDIADYALEALRHSNVRDIYVLGRRGPAQAKFTTPEIKELGEMADAEITIPGSETVLDAISAAEMENADRQARTKVEVIQSYADRPVGDKSKRITLRFLVSPVELIGNAEGQVTAIKIVKNKLVQKADGRTSPVPTDEFETIPVGLVFRSIGYMGEPLGDIPFHIRWGVINNREGRVVDVDSGAPVVGEYTAGWIKRGPTGIIGTNKPDALETVNHMLEDAAAGLTLQPEAPDPAAVLATVADQQPDYISYADWEAIDAAELARGAEAGRVRVKFVSSAEMLAALGRA